MSSISLCVEYACGDDPVGSPVDDAELAAIRSDWVTMKRMLSETGLA